MMQDSVAVMHGTGPDAQFGGWNNARCNCGASDLSCTTSQKLSIQVRTSAQSKMPSQRIDMMAAHSRSISAQVEQQSRLSKGVFAFEPFRSGRCVARRPLR